jgi:hypothetical protein
MKIKTLATLAGVVCAAALLISLPAQAQKARLMITNQSNWEIHQFYLSPVDSDEWGQEWLAGQVIGRGQTQTMLGIRCDAYDVKLVDEDGDECVVHQVDFCGGHEGWTITNDNLLRCQDRTQSE